MGLRRSGVLGTGLLPCFSYGGDHLRTSDDGTDDPADWLPDKSADRDTAGLWMCHDWDLGETAGRRRRAGGRRIDGLARNVKNISDER